MSEGKFRRATHVVSSGENLVEIGAMYGVSWRDMAVDNELDNRDLIHPGQVLKLPYCEYTVVEGDTLTGIHEAYVAKRAAGCPGCHDAGPYGASLRDVARYNQIDNPDLIHPGQVVKLPLR
ncbi:hypothetical protein BJP40_06800 [Streptomyces sp. CC53]|uniref:LysM peptidoglycan-binding domain-containing protein n=1 Tax=Streptomyces sp. CC53 TaxID=1906740 RepID=UPI0008DD00E7|nr:LysM domain-containing protein [Streptomyces sp. CC53]OII61229.1 hypothetical protein BJP40_06800 [Streptomyces sp. CC53]